MYILFINSYCFSMHNKIYLLIYYQNCPNESLMTDLYILMVVFVNLLMYNILKLIQQMLNTVKNMLYIERLGGIGQWVYSCMFLPL